MSCIVIKLHVCRLDRLMQSYILLLPCNYYLSDNVRPWPVMFPYKVSLVHWPPSTQSSKRHLNLRSPRRINFTLKCTIVFVLENSHIVKCTYNNLSRLVIFICYTLGSYTPGDGPLVHEHHMVYWWRYGVIGVRSMTLQHMSSFSLEV